jgi:hypothetical protein
MVSTFTPNLGYEKPGDGDSNWGTAWNSNADIIDIDLGTEHKSGGAHGPKVTIEQTNADNALVINHNNGSAVGVDVNRTTTSGTTDVIHIDNSSGGASLHLTQDTTVNNNALYIEMGVTQTSSLGACLELELSHRGRGILINGNGETSSARDLFCINANHTGAYEAVVISHLGTDELMRLDKTGTSGEGVIINMSSTDAGVIINQNVDGLALDINKTTAGSANVIEVLNSGTGMSLIIDQDSTTQPTLAMFRGGQATGTQFLVNNTSTGGKAWAVGSAGSSGVTGTNSPTTPTGSFYWRETGTNFNALILEETGKLTLTQSGSGIALLLNQDGNGVALDIDSEATSQPLINLTPINTNTRGDIAFGTARTSDPSSPSEGDIWYNSTDNNLYLYDGTTNVDLTAAGGGGGNTLDQAYDEGGAGAGRTIIADNGAVQINNTASGDAVLEITASNTSVSQVSFGDSDDVNIGRVRYDHASNSLDFFTNDTERMNIDSSGNVNVLNDLVVSGSATVSGKLTVTGGVDPDYMQLTPQGTKQPLPTDPWTTAYGHIPKGSLFVDANDGDKLKFLHEDGVTVYEISMTPSQFGEV